MINKMNAITAITLFVLYSVITGLTLSVIFLVYELGSIVSVFGIASLIFAAMSIYGYTTKKDLTGIGTIAIFGLIGIIIAGIVNMFLMSSMLHFITSVLGVVIFVGLTAWDTQRIKDNYSESFGEETNNKMAVFGALNLYLNFINLFQYMLQFMGSRRN